MRDHEWLETKLQELLKAYFAQMPITNPIEIRWGREAKFRFGSIKLQGHKGYKRAKGLAQIFGFKRVEMQESLQGKVPRKSLITITSMFKDEKIPVDVVCYTIAHELTHYAHGFSSTNKRMFRHPHHGGGVNAQVQKAG